MPENETPTAKPEAFLNLETVMQYAVMVESLIDSGAWDAIEEMIRMLPPDTMKDLLRKLRGLQNLAANILPHFEGEL